MHVRPYILFAIDYFFMPDTFGSKVHLQYLPFLENIGTFKEFLLGSVALAHLYSELHEAIKPKRTNMIDCLHLLQVWA